MTTTTMHFGPEWMRTKQAPSRPAPSPPLATNPASPAAAVSSYSALVAPASQPPPEKSDLARPFRYSKEDLLRIYREGGGKGGLGLEVERWEGIVREVGHDPIGLKEMSEAERKIFAGSLNSEIRRRQSTDYLSPLNTTLGERPKLGHTTSAGSPLRERIGTFAGRRRDSTDQPPLTLPRKPSFSSMSGPLASPRDAPLPSPRVRVGSGFDGVLDGSWTAKRRAAESLAKSSSKADLKDVQDQGIKEEEEEASHSVDPGTSVPLENGTTGQQSNGSIQLNPEGDIRSRSQAVPLQDSSTTPSVPPGIANPDSASVEWSYLDPQGQIQGPFRADIMQKWYDEGYFAVSLLMRRTHIDTEWTSVGDLLRAAGGGKIFIASPPKQRANIPEHVFNNGPLEPVPSRALRTTGLDSYFQTGSTASNSPTSSFSAGRFGNGSPDTSILPGRIGAPLQQAQGVNAFNGLNSVEPLRRQFEESLEVSANGRPYGGYSPARGGQVDPFMSNDRVPYSPGFDNTVFNTTRPNLDMSVVNGQNNAPVFGTNSPVPIGGGFAQQDQSRIMPLRQTRPGVESRMSGYSSENASPFLQHAQAATQGQQIPYQNGVPVANEHVGVTHVQTLPQQQHYPVPPVSPWGVPETRRPGPFEPDYPTARNTATIPRAVAPGQALGGVQPSPIHVPPQSPWGAVPHPGTYEPWATDNSRFPVVGAESVPQVQQKQIAAQTTAEQASPVIPEVASADVREFEPASSSETAVPPPAPESTPTRSKKQRKEPSPATLKPVSPALAPAPVPAAVPAKTPSPAPSPADAKPAWAVDEEKPSAVTSLREIQELEAKQAEARKAAERAARAASAAISTPSTEELQSFTASWGLPTSQAGASRSNPLLKEAAASPSPMSSSGSTPAVWTNSAKATVAKKTMKEIQEEEEKRKKQAAKEKETIAAAARRAYAETTTKIVPSAQSASTGVWTTVGSSGKTPTAPVTATAPRPAVPTTPSKPVTPTISTVATPSRPVASPAKPVTVASRVAASIPKIEETPAPSSDFLKWLSDSLKGLNNSVNFEEIISMLLSFPLDPDPSTVELISDLIYANSTTLDGRRFAAEFVSRRKASTKTTAAPSTASVPKTLSIAEVVKTQPKPAQNEWGGFKVVNKKKKGGRN